MTDVVARSTYTYAGNKSPVDPARKFRYEDASGNIVWVNMGETASLTKAQVDYLGHRYVLTPGTVVVDVPPVPPSPGASAYEIWKSQGNTGTVDDFLKSLKGGGEEGVSDSGLAPRARHQYLAQRNDFANPLAVGNPPANFTATFASGSSATGSPGVNDPDIGTAASAVATYPGDFAGHAVNFGKTVANAVVKTTIPYTDVAHVITYFRAKVKIAAGPNVPMTLKLHAYSQDGNGGNVRDVGIDYRDGVNVGDIIVMEGFDVSGSSNDHVGGYVTLDAAGLTGQTTVDLRVTEVQIVLDPKAEPHFGSGASNRWAWRGAANASVSEGFAAREALNEKLPAGHGFQGTTQFDRQIDTAVMGPETEVRMLAAIGATMHRGDLSPVSLNPAGGSAWPQANTEPNWRSPAMKWYADYMDAMRRHGLKACPIIGAPLGWMTTDGATDLSYSLRTLDPAKYDQFAQLYISLIDEWPDVITAVELFNEPNFTGVWGGTPDPALFSQHMIALTDRIRAKHPDVKIVGPALARIIDGVAAASGIGAETFLQGIYDHGLAQKLDAISIHPYSYSAMTGYDASATPGTQGNFNFYINQILKVMRANSDGAKKLWITENGGTHLNGGTWTLRNVAIYNMLCRVIAARRPEIEAYFTHSICDSYQQVGASRAYGQFDLDKGHPRLSFYALADAKLPESDWINIPMANGWVPLDINSVPLQYKVLPDGDVRVRGQIKGGSSATAAMGVVPFKMPMPRIGWFPAMGLNVSTWQFAMIQFNGDGTIYANQGGQPAGMIFDFTFTPGA